MITQKLNDLPERGLKIIAFLVLGIATAALCAMFIGIVVKYPGLLGGMI